MGKWTVEKSTSSDFRKKKEDKEKLTWMEALNFYATQKKLHGTIWKEDADKDTKLKSSQDWEGLRTFISIFATEYNGVDADDSLYDDLFKHLQGIYKSFYRTTEAHNERRRLIERLLSAEKY